MHLKSMQINQPWNNDYANGVLLAEKHGDVPHILGSHNALHVAKTAGKLCAVFEVQDHPLNETGFGPSKLMDGGLQTVKDMAADLVAEALRFANLYHFDLETECQRRAIEKNGVGYGGG